MPSCHDEAETVAAWMRFLMGENWAELPGASVRLGRFLSSRHDLTPKKREDIVKRSVSSPRSVSVSPHAIGRFQHRSGSKKHYRHIEQMLLKMAQFADEVALKDPHLEVGKLLNHGCREATYLRAGIWILVVVDEEIRTVYQDDKKWKPKPQICAGSIDGPESSN